MDFLSYYKYSKNTFMKNRIETKFSKELGYKTNIVEKALFYKKAECFIDWGNYDRISLTTGVPDWKSIMYVPLIKNGTIEYVVYVSVPISEKEFKEDEFSLMKLLSDIFLVNF